MGKAPVTPFEAELAEFFGETAPDGSQTATLDLVTFRATDPATPPLEAAEDLVRHIRARNKARAHLSRDARINARTHTSYSGAVTVRVARQGHRFHTVKFSAAADGAMLASHKVAGGHDLSLMLHEWLTASDRFGSPCWRTAEEWKRGGGPGRDTPN